VQCGSLAEQSKSTFLARRIQPYAAHAQQMPTRALAILFASSSQKMMHWLLHLGGIGLIPLGLLDSSVIPLPGSMDLFTILLSARDKHLWFYYAAMATVGSVLGGYLTYRLARKGGKETLDKKFSKRKIGKILKAFEHWGFAAIAIPAVLPPPFPMVPFLVAAGALQYSRAKFLIALTLGRAIRYTVLAFLAATYGRQILRFLSQHAYTLLFISIGVAVAAGVVVLLIRVRSKK
jgi:membrane protein YqaA with SNARE-associated domain